MLSAETIEQWAFRNCASLVSVTLGEITDFDSNQTSSISDPFPGNALRTAVMAEPAGSGAGTYTRTPPNEDWTKQ